jgi:hypothetical protein
MIASVISTRSSSGVNAVISFDLPSTTDWPSTIPLRTSNAASKCTARPSARRAPRADLPSTAITLGGGPIGAGPGPAPFPGALLSGRVFPSGFFSGGFFSGGFFSGGFFSGGSGVGGLVVSARATSQSDTTRSSASGSTLCRIRRIADSLGVARRTVSPSRIRTPSGRSWAHSAMAT